MQPLQIFMFATRDENHVQADKKLCLSLGDSQSDNARSFLCGVLEFFHGNHVEAPHLTLLQLHELWAYTPSDSPKPYVMISTLSLDTIRITNMDMSLARLDYSRITCICIVKINSNELFLLL